GAPLFQDRRLGGAADKHRGQVLDHVLAARAQRDLCTWLDRRGAAFAHAAVDVHAAGGADAAPALVGAGAQRAVRVLVDIVEEREHAVALLVGHLEALPARLAVARWIEALDVDDHGLLGHPAHPPALTLAVTGTAFRSRSDSRTTGAVPSSGSPEGSC